MLLVAPKRAVFSRLSTYFSGRSLIIKDGGADGGELAHPQPPTSLLTRKPVVEKSPFEIAAKRLEIDHICQ